MVSPRAVVARILVVLLVVFTLVLLRPALTHARAMGVLLRMTGGTENPMGLRDLGTVPTTKETMSLELPGAKVRAYRYEPATGPTLAGIVLVHGVHYRGIDEPRLVRFAEALAAAGLTVLTPEVPSLADYRVTHDAVVEIGAAAHALREQLGGEKPVGVIGVSFAGSLALLAAAEKDLGVDIGYVVTVGSYDDLGRVCRFFAAGSITRPDGSVVTLRPHDYGPVVWVYAHLEDFFPDDGRDEVRIALRHWLHEERDDARAAVLRLPDASRVKLEALFKGDLTPLTPGLLADVDRHLLELEALSPHGHLDGLHVAVFAIHGSDDHLIPPSETLWLAHDIPPGMLAYALVSRALTHVELGDKTSLAERIQVVHFMAGILAEARR